MDNNGLSSQEKPYIDISMDIVMLKHDRWLQSLVLTHTKKILQTK